MMRVNEQTALELGKLNYKFVRLIVNFSGFCFVEYGYFQDMIAIRRMVEYSIVSILSKQLSLTAVNTSIVKSDLSGMVVECTLPVPNTSNFTAC